MNCSEFESTLVDLLAGPGAAAGGRLARLREHAATCPACAGSRDLVEIAARPVDERDPVDDPGEAYWQAFGPRLSARLAAASTRRRRYLAALGGIAAAAAVTVGLLIGVSRRAAEPLPVAESRPAVPPPETVAPPEDPFRSETPRDPRPVDGGLGIDDDLAEGFALPTPLDSFDESDESSLFPAVDALSPAEATRFLEWLTQEESRVRKGAA